MLSKLVILVLGVVLLVLMGYLAYIKVGGEKLQKVKIDESSVVPVNVEVGTIGQPFNRGLVTISFDDGHESQFKNAVPLLEKNKFLATFYISTGLLGTKGYMSDDQVRELVGANYHIGAHTISHPHLPPLSDLDQDKELGESQKYLQDKFGVGAQDFASPYGDVNEQVMHKVIEKYRSHRNVLPGFNYRDSLDLYGVKVQNILVTTTAEEVSGWVRAAKENKSWLVLVYHQIDGGGDKYSATPENFEKHIEVIAKSGISVVSFDKALAEILPQIAK